MDNGAGRSGEESKRASIASCKLYDYTKALPFDHSRPQTATDAPGIEPSSPGAFSDSAEPRSMPRRMRQERKTLASALLIRAVRGPFGCSASQASWYRRKVFSRVRPPKDASSPGLELLTWPLTRFHKNNSQAGSHNASQRRETTGITNPSPSCCTKAATNEQSSKLPAATASKSSAPACSSSVSRPKAAGTC